MIGIHLVELNRQWRTNCALGQGAYDCSVRVSPHYSYSLFTVYFTMTSRLTPWVALQSPPSLDWVQVFAAALIVLNAWYFYGILKDFRRRRSYPVKTA